MKKIVIYLVCITIFLQLGFQAFQIVTQLICHKIEIETAIKAGKYNTHLMQFTESDLLKAKWDGDKEFELENQKYDLVRKSITANVTVYFCINDKIEKSLEKALDKAAQKSKSQQSQSSKNTLLFYSGTSSSLYQHFYSTIQTAKPIVMHLLLDGFPNLPFQPPISVA